MLGLDPDQYRAFLVDHDVPHTKLGRTVIARVDDVLEALARLSANTDTPIAIVPKSDDEPSTVDDVLARLGMKRSA